MFFRFLIDLDLGCCLDFLPCSEMSFLSAYFEFLLVSEEESETSNAKEKANPSKKI